MSQTPTNGVNQQVIDKLTDPPAQDRIYPSKVNLDTEIAFGGKNHKISELIEAAKEREALASKTKELEEYKSHAEAMMAEDTDPQRMEKAVRFLMAKRGYNPEQIEKYVQENMNQNDAAAPARNPRQTGGGEDRQAELEQALAQTQQQLHKQAVARLKDKLTGSARSALDANKEFATMMGRAKERDPDGWSKLGDEFRSEVEEETLRRVNYKKSMTGQFDENWFSEEAVKAADSVSKKWKSRAVIGDVGRSPETVTGADEFLKRTPPPPPTFKEDVSRGDVEANVRAYNEDQLVRMAFDSMSTGTSKV